MPRFSLKEIGLSRRKFARRGSPTSGRWPVAAAVLACLVQHAQERLARCSVHADRNQPFQAHTCDLGEHDGIPISRRFEGRPDAGC